MQRTLTAAALGMLMALAAPATAQQTPTNRHDLLQAQRLQQAHQRYESFGSLWAGLRNLFGEKHAGRVVRHVMRKGDDLGLSVSGQRTLIENRRQLCLNCSARQFGCRGGRCLGMGLEKWGLDRRTLTVRKYSPPRANVRANVRARNQK